MMLNLLHLPNHSLVAKILIVKIFVDAVHTTENTI